MSLLRGLSRETGVSEAHLDSVRRLRRTMQEAVALRDWGAIRRTDRLCGQMARRFSSTGLEHVTEFVAELTVIRDLYSELLLDISWQIVKTSRS